MPSRHPQPKNVTGIYLGLEGNIKPPRERTGIPPLARSRGISYKVRTPVEERRYEPAAYLEKKQMVELMRIKEEKRGFVGQPLKKHQVKDEKRSSTSSPPPSPRRWGPAKRASTAKFSDRIRTNPRHYTPIINSGITRSENLTGFSSYSLSTPDMTRLHLVDNMSDDLNRLGYPASQPDHMTTLTDNYKQLYETNIIYDLLPRRTHTPTRNREGTTYSTGFSVRSYRNPNQAEILADFPDPKAKLRPKTVPANQAFVPQPYFFRYYNQHRPIRTISAKSKYSIEDKESVYSGSRVLAAPGAGSISKSLSQRQLNRQKHNSSPVESDQPPTTFHKSDESDVNISMPVSSTSQNPSKPVELTEKLDSRTQSSKQSNSDNKSEQSMAEVATIEERRDSLFPEETRKMRPLKTSNSGADITLGLEDVDGTTAEVEIDDNEAEIAPEEVPRGRVRKASIVEKLSKTKASEAYVATVKESAEQRAKDFEKLLNEHAEIVQEIGRTASAENLNSESDERDP